MIAERIRFVMALRYRPGCSATQRRVPIGTHVGELRIGLLDGLKKQDSRAVARHPHYVIGGHQALGNIDVEQSSRSTIFHVGPLQQDTAEDEEGGVNDVSGTGRSQNTILGNWVNDAYAGVC